MSTKKILAICGSTRRQSSNLSILHILADTYADRFDFEIYTAIDQLPHFNPDLDKEAVPSAVSDLRESIEKADGLVICTPEYVFSLPGSLKNALDWMVSSVVLSDKPVALITAAMSGEKAHASLALIMKTLGANFNEQTQLLIQGAKGKFDQHYQLKDTQTSADLHHLMQSLAEIM